MNRDIFDLCKFGNPDELLLAIQNGADINTLNEDGFTPLSWACYFGNVKCVEVLISAGADVNQKNNEGLTPLHIAAYGSDGSGSYGMNSKCLELLIRSNADINKIDVNGDTPLHIAAIFDAEYCIKVLIESGADVTIKNDKGKTFLKCIRGEPVLKEEMKEFLHSYEFPIKEPSE